MSLNDWITLNVGGRQFETSRLTLVSCPDSLLAEMFSLESSSPPSTVSTDGAFRIDADPDAFVVLLNWLRRKKLMMNDRTNLENVAIEADAFVLLDLKDVVEERKEIKVEQKKEIIEEERKREIKEERSKEYKEKQQRKEDKEEDRRNAKKDEWMEEQKTTRTPPMSKLEKIGRSSKPDRAIRKKKILPRILPKPIFKKKQSIKSLKRQIEQQNFDVGIESFSISKSSNHFAKTSFSNEVVSTITSSTESSASHSFDTAGCVVKASAAPPTRKLKEPSKVSKIDTDVEVLELKKPINNQEVTEAVPKVIKAELDENQNHEPTILCGICYKPFSKNAGALIAQCNGFEGDRTRLLMHVRAKHTKEKLFKCEMCEDSFATCAAKKTHQKRH